MSPLGAVITADGRLNVSIESPATPGLPSVNNTFPSRLNLTTTWPLPPAPEASATQTFPSRSTCIPCGNTNRPAPNARTKFPVGSNCTTGGSDDSAQELSPQRSNTHTLPLRSTSSVLVDPQARPSGIFAQPVTVRHAASCATTHGTTTKDRAKTSFFKLRIMPPWLTRSESVSPRLPP